MKKNADSRGFTLVELMIVVTIVGVLAVLATIGVRKYIANSKTAEVRNALGQIGKDAATAFDKPTIAAAIVNAGATTTVLRTLCKGGSKSVPASSSSIQGRKYQSAPSEWNVDAAGNSGFACLRFSLDEPQYYMYGYNQSSAGTASGNSFTAVANGDLNGNGITSTFTLTGAINASLVLDIAAELSEVNPDE